MLKAAKEESNEQDGIKSHKHNVNWYYYIIIIIIFNKKKFMKKKR